ncbi:glycoside hydrolase family protein [Planoprotostelium fungivorum]|uniref:Glycoside hydrolase family protein n=1 Tax=Planoprotostelium fungivorum TaxID=1890364 RepID=A0A2P6MVZ3_9EUKA|nr:glycoside hydrolase family protein [Planoprotostelium fungivorum]
MILQLPRVFIALHLRSGEYGRFDPRTLSPFNNGNHIHILRRVWLKHQSSLATPAECARTETCLLPPYRQTIPGRPDKPRSVWGNDINIRLISTVKTLKPCPAHWYHKEHFETENIRIDICLPIKRPKSPFSREVTMRSIVLSTLLIASCLAWTPYNFTSLYPFYNQQLRTMLGAIDYTGGKFPVATTTSGSWAGGTLSDQSTWGANYGPGAAWLMYELTNDTYWQNTAQTLQDYFAPNQYRNTSHDVGMILMTTFGNCYRLTGNTSIPQILRNGADSLTTRFDPYVGLMKSWSTRAGTYQVIADNMMNLELFMKVYLLTNETSYLNLALTHARNTIKWFVRPDFGSFHVLDMSQTDARPLVRGTQQGYSAGSTWTRGHAWFVYAFSFMYQHTQLPEFLTAVQGITQYWIDRQLPGPDGVYVPVWDFDDPTPNKPRDTSCAGALAVGLLRLASLQNDTINNVYFQKADALLQQLSQPPYLNTTSNWQSILQQGSRDVPANNQNTGISWGEYYYLEAIVAYNKMVAAYQSK